MTPAIDYATCSEKELWHHVAGHLESEGLEVVLVGGAVVSIYSEGAYRSGDLDFVQTGLLDSLPTEAMAELGFERRGRHFAHPECSHLFVEFVSGPLGIGEDLDVHPSTEVVEGRALKILSPTDCVRDRLASYVHFGAAECLDQALLVARAHDLDWDKIERWCRGEGPRGTEAYGRLRRLVESSG